MRSEIFRTCGIGKDVFYICVVWSMFVNLILASYKVNHMEFIYLCMYVAN